MGDNFNLLPKLQDKRLKLAGKQSSRTRKMTQIMNDTLKKNTDVYTKTLDKASRNFEFKMWQKEVPVKQQRQQINSTLRCLKNIKDPSAINDETKLFGSYQGVSLNSLKYEIDRTIRDSNPRNKRLKKVEKILNNGKSCGQLVDYKEARNQLEMIINRPSFPRKGEVSLDLLRPGSSEVPTGYSARERTSLRLPPMNISRENTGTFFRRENSNFARMKSRSLPSIPHTYRSKTFIVEKSLKRFSIAPSLDERYF